ncbi:MAG TPA: hypothetical protein VIS03_10475 [Kiloniellaceae bacterium]
MPRVYDLGHSRAGDKGNTSNVSVIAYDETAWHILRRHLTAERVLAAYAHLGAGPVTRYELPLLRALNFVIENALGGGVTRSLAQDMHGKSLSTLILTIEMPEAS